MNYSFKTVSALAVISIFGFTSCSKESKQKVEENSSVVTNDELVIPKDQLLKPIPVKYQEMVKADNFTMDVAKGFSGTTKKGMEIKIPSDALVDENNQPVVGEVELEVSEYYSPAEIIVSNIPMEYMDGDELKHFQSDGMFTIKATQNGKKLKVAEDQNVKLTTKRSKEGTGFEFYSLEENKWVKNTSNDIEPLGISEKRIPILKSPINPGFVNLTKYNPKHYTIEKDERTYLPEHNKEQTSARSKDYVKQITVDVTENPWILDRKNWKFSKRERFILKKDSLRQKKFDTVPYSVNYAIRGNKKFQELFNKDKDAREKYAKDLKAFQENYEARLAAGQLSVSERTQELIVKQFGTYNIDRYYNQPMLVEKDFEITLPTNIHPSDRIFLIVKQGDETLIPIDLSVYEPIVKFSQKERNALIVMGEDIVYAIKKDDFSRMTKKQMSYKTFDFQLKEELTFTSTEEFNELLNNLF